MGPTEFSPEFGPAQALPPELTSKWLLACGQGTKIFRGCRLAGAERIRVGSHSQIDEGVFIFAGQGVTIGNHVHLAFGSSISGGGECIIDDFAGIGAGVRLLTGSDSPGGEGLTNPTVPDAFRSVRRGKIEVGAHALVFTNAVIFPDVVLGEGCVVAAGSLVHRSLDPWRIYAGNPLVPIAVRPKEVILARAAQLRAEERC